jgi:hypothetical protein
MLRLRQMAKELIMKTCSNGSRVSGCAALGGLLATLSLAGVASATVYEMPTPEDYQPGQKFRIMFITSGTISATSTDISTYDNFVMEQAGGATYCGGTVAFKAVASIGSMNARDHVGGFGSGVQVFMPNGNRVALGMTDGNWGDLWSGSPGGGRPIDCGINGQSLGYSLVWTGTDYDGISSGTWGAMGGESVVYGWNGWMQSIFSTQDRMSSSESLRMYAISEELTVGMPGTGAAVPAPGAAALVGLAGVLGCRRRRA